MASKFTLTGNWLHTTAEYHYRHFHVQIPPSLSSRPELGEKQSNSLSLSKSSLSLSITILLPQPLLFYLPNPIQNRKKKLVRKKIVWREQNWRIVVSFITLSHQSNRRRWEMEGNLELKWGGDWFCVAVLCLHVYIQILALGISFLSLLLLDLTDSLLELLSDLALSSCLRQSMLAVFGGLRLAIGLVFCVNVERFEWFCYLHWLCSRCRSFRGNRWECLLPWRLLSVPGLGLRIR